MNMAATLISLLDDAAVNVFGCVLSVAFCYVPRTRRDRWIVWTGIVLLLIPQEAVYLLWGTEARLRAYPFAVHLPLLLLLRFLTGKWLWPAISILTAYLFCQMRRWPALLAAFLLPGEEMTRQIVEIAFTLPLLLFLLRFTAPALRQLMGYPRKNQCQFALIPALYYAFDYITRVYTDLLMSGEPVVVEFMPTVCCAAYLVFLLYNVSVERRRSLLQQTQDNLNLQMAQASREISALRESQAMAARHRHDLRHHMQYLLSCIENGQDERAKAYISGICAEIEAQQVQRYCENEAANLILSSFAARAEKIGAEMEVRGALPAAIPVTDNDLCVILSNALENALHACQPLAEAGGPCAIGVEFRSQEQGRLFLQIANTYSGGVLFENGVPVSREPGHGIGVQSIRAIVERYGGGCTFLAQDGQFILRLFL